MSHLMPPGWTWHTDPQGRVFYHHAPSGVTQWHPPAPEPAVGGPSSSGPWTGVGASSQQPAAPSGFAGTGPGPGPGAAAAWSSPGTSRFTFNERRDLKVKEVFGLLTDNFDIVDGQSGQPVFRMQGTLGGFSRRKVLLDLNGTNVYVLAEMPLSLRGRMKVQDGLSNQVVVTMRKKSFIPMMGTNIVQGWRGDTDEGEPWIEMKGNFLHKQYSVTDQATKRVLATVSRKTSLMSILFEKDSYVVSVEPGVDCALMVVIVVALDELYREGKGGGHGLAGLAF